MCAGDKPSNYRGYTSSSPIGASPTLHSPKQQERLRTALLFRFSNKDAIQGAEQSSQGKSAVASYLIPKTVGSRMCFLLFGQNIVLVPGPEVQLQGYCGGRVELGVEDNFSGGGVV